jgi:hypothetical protein
VVVVVVQLIIKMQVVAVVLVEQGCHQEQLLVVIQFPL